MPKPLTRQQTKGEAEIEIYAALRAESVAMIDMQRRLIDAGLIATARAVNAASQKLGFEAEKLLKRTKRKPTRSAR